MADNKIKPIKIEVQNSSMFSEKNVGKHNFTFSMTQNGQLNRFNSDLEKVETETFLLSDLENQIENFQSINHFTLNGVSQCALGLNSPTQIVKYSDTYFIVNTFSNMILFSKDMENWNLIDAPNGESFNLAHSIAFDGKNLVITDTENKRMLLYEFQENQFVYTGDFDDQGLKTRFHYVTYNQENDTYYAVASEFGDSTRTYEFKIQDGKFVDSNGGNLRGKEIKESNGMNYVVDNQSYVRSFTIEGDSILMPIHNQNKSSELLIMDKDFNVQKTVSVPDSIGGVTCIKKVDDYYVLTSSTERDGTLSSNIAVAKNLEDFEKENYKIADAALYKNSENYTGNNEPIPYFIESFNGKDWITINNSKTPICEIHVDEKGNVQLLNSSIK